ncbi:hypothetical protein [Halodesulfovibrio aestuarii]|uniref:hypothetical protein n=1 Tax=Halodesulfovibrio aestuarii TaxID=126333 RepID=UPI003D3474D7
MVVLSIISGLCAIAPTIAKWIGGDHAEKVTKDVVGMAKSVTGTDSEEAALAALQQNPEMALAFEKAWQSYELGLEKELTKRHQADMQSDSWLSKNVRPLVLLSVTVAVFVATFVSEAYLPADKYKFLTELCRWTFGYYFISRSALDKKGVQLPNPLSLLGRK